MATPEQHAIESAGISGDRAAALGVALPNLALVWEALDAIPDPEIPVVSIVELGIVREVACDGSSVVVRVTPTYSGCPATEVIREAIRTALDQLGMRDARIETRLAPAWSTDWLTPEAKRKLASFGIAPPGGPAPRIDVTGISPLRRERESVTCPRCGSTQTRLVAQFGSTACKAQYRCEACAEPFDYFKPY